MLHLHERVVHVYCAQANVDYNIGGTFKSTRARGTVCDLSTIINQYTYQYKYGPNAVVLVYDPVLSTSGSLSVKVRPQLRKPTHPCVSMTHTHA